MVDFAELKKRRGKRKEEIQKKLESASKSKRGKDERIYYPELDENKKGAAIIRFLPGHDGDQPFISYDVHGFKAKKGWLIANCPKTIHGDDSCPICNHAWEEWNDATTKAEKDRVKQKLPNTKYISNILVVRDPKNPENEGKVFLFEYGPAIMKMIKAAMEDREPDFEDEPMIPGIDPFDMWEGANFKLKIRLKDPDNPKSMITYEDSEFMPAAPISDDDEEIEAVFKQQYDLSEFHDPKRFESFDELETRLKKVLGLHVPAKSKGDSVAESATSDDDGFDDDVPFDDEHKTDGAKSEPAGGGDDFDDLDDLF